MDAATHDETELHGYEACYLAPTDGKMKLQNNYGRVVPVFWLGLSYSSNRKCGWIWSMLLEWDGTNSTFVI